MPDEIKPDAPATPATPAPAAKPAEEKPKDWPPKQDKAPEPEPEKEDDWREWGWE